MDLTSWAGAPIRLGLSLAFVGVTIAGYVYADNRKRGEARLGSSLLAAGYDALGPLGAAIYWDRRRRADQAQE